MSKEETLEMELRLKVEVPESVYDKYDHMKRHRKLTAYVQEMINAYERGEFEEENVSTKSSGKMEECLDRLGDVMQSFLERDKERDELLSSFIKKEKEGSNEGEEEDVEFIEDEPTFNFSETSDYKETVPLDPDDIYIPDEEEDKNKNKGEEGSEEEEKEEVEEVVEDVDELSEKEKEIEKLRAELAAKEAGVYETAKKDVEKKKRTKPNKKANKQLRGMMDI